MIRVLHFTELCIGTLSISFNTLTVAGLVVVIGSILLLCWRTWRFTILPLLHPDEPLDLPYWIPCKSDLSVRSKMTAIGILR